VNPAVNDRCPQCGAQLRGRTTCAEQLYRMLVSGGIAQEARVREALAQYALSHPMTYSTEALQVASELLAHPEPAAAGREADGEAADPASSICRWWRHFARRMSCH